MILAFDIHHGETSRIYDTCEWHDGMPADLVEIGEMMALEAFIGGEPELCWGYVRVEQYPKPSTRY